MLVFFGLLRSVFVTASLLLAFPVSIVQSVALPTRGWLVGGGGCSVWLGQCVRCSPVDRGGACSQERDGGHDDVPVQKLSHGKSNSPFLQLQVLDANVQ